MSNTYENETQTTTAIDANGKKRFPKLPILLFGILLLCTLFVIAFLYFNSNYYIKAQQKVLNQIAHTSKNVYDDYLNTLELFTKEKTAQQVNIKLNVNPSISKTYFSIDNLKPIDIKQNLFLNANKEGKLETKILYDSKPLLSYNATLDILHNKLYLQVPELNKAIVSMDTKNEDDNSMSNAFTKLMSNLGKLRTYFSPEDLSNTIKKYGSFFIRNEKHVNIEKNKTLTIDDTSTTCSMLCINYTNVELNEISNLTINELKRDTVLRSFFAKFFETSKEQYDTYIEDLLDELEDSDGISPEDAMKVCIWLDKDNNPMGYELTILTNDNPDDNLSIGFQNIKKDQNRNFKIYATYKNNQFLVATISSKEKESIFDGTVTLEGNLEDKKFEYTFDFKEFQIKDYAKKTFNGTFTFPLPSVPGLRIVLDAKEKEGIQSCKVSALLLIQKILDVELSYALIDYKDFPIPPKGKIYDEANIEEYSSQTDIEKFYTHARSILGDDLFNLLKEKE